MMKRRKYKKKEKIHLYNQKKEKIKVSEFFTLIRKLNILNSISNYKFFQNKN